MKRLITLAGGLVLLAACSNPSASTGENLVSTKATARAASPASTAALKNDPAATVESAGASAAGLREVTLPAGTVLPVDLETAIGSDISRVEEPVQGRLRHSVSLNGVQVLPAGMAVNGFVTAAQRPGKVKGRGYIAVRFTELDTPGPGMTEIHTAAIGHLAPATKGKDAVKIGAPAAAGAVIGSLVGGKGGAGAGALIGGGAGTGYVLATRGKDVRIAKGADLSVRLTAPVTVKVGS